MALVGAGRRLYRADRFRDDRAEPADLILDGVRARTELGLLDSGPLRLRRRSGEGVRARPRAVRCWVAWPRRVGAAPSSSLASGLGGCRGGPGAGARLSRPSPDRATFQSVRPARG